MSYKVRQLILDSGERLPVLCSATGMPIGNPLLYVLTELRARGRSSATIRHAMEAVMVLCMTLDRQRISLDDRLRRGTFLQLHELDLIVRDASQKIRAIASDAIAPIGRASAASRLHYILQYLRWHASRHLLLIDIRTDEYLALRDRIERACSSLKARSPCAGVRSEIDQRQGLSEEHLNKVLLTAGGANDQSIWTNEHARTRNRLLLRWFLDLGVRRGEILGVRTSDIDFQQNIVRIARRADSKHDPRAQQPLVKTKARDLSLSDDLAESTYDYVMGLRAKQGAARRHDYLFVASGSGRPLSLAGLSKIFTVMRAADPNFPQELTPHVLRHTWNDRFSLTMEKSGINPEMEKKMRSMLMGWSPTSDTAAVYTRRHVRKMASQAMKDMQKQLRIQGGKNE